MDSNRTVVDLAIARLGCPTDARPDIKSAVKVPGSYDRPATCDTTFEDDISRLAGRSLHGFSGQFNRFGLCKTAGRDAI